MAWENRKPCLFSNKIETLLYLKEKLTTSYILDLYFFSVSDYRDNPDGIFDKISFLFNSEIIVRSAASTEDQNSSNAGHFSSVQHVDSQNRNSTDNAISIVINSYKKDGLSDSELIFVQKQLKDVILAGVALSYEPVCGKPYFFINYDDSGSTSSVTNGTCNKCMYIARDLNLSTNTIESKLCLALLEVEMQCNTDNLNIEFAITKGNEVYIFQVRHLKRHATLCKNCEIFNKKNEIIHYYSLNPLLLSDMAFWNPSEMIGDNPHPLDYSLYKYLITDNAWNVGIAEIGYFNTYENLMVKLGNKPYIKMKTAFSALIPKSLSKVIRDKLTCYYCNTLLEKKYLHDKIEFEICFTCFDFCTTKKIKNLYNYGFSDVEVSEISHALYELTKTNIKNYKIFLKDDLAKISNLEAILDKCKASNVTKVKDIITSILMLLSEIRDNGIVPFARQARHAFIAKSFCISALEANIITSEHVDLFMHSIITIASELQLDVQHCNENKVSKETIMEKYGHLRPNTYDILSPTYEKLGFAKVFGSIGLNHLHQNDKHEIEEFELKMPISEISLTQFIKDSIVNREYFKFVFTKAVSYVLDLIEEVASLLGLTIDEVAYLNIDDIMSYNEKNITKEDLLDIIIKNKNEFINNSFLEFPSVISSSDDLNIVRIDRNIPNFVTNKIVEGETIIIEKVYTEMPNVSGKIVILERADPGFDWIFTKGVCGLVTKYGGMASHMAIRCIEFGIPAVIGCGELLYNRIRMSKKVKIDCLAKEVLIL